jgi:hypothetical protein
LKHKAATAEAKAATAAAAIAEGFLGDCQAVARRSLSTEQIAKAILNKRHPKYLQAIPTEILAKTNQS